MTKPERIWATPFDEWSDGGTYCNAESRPTAPNYDASCYVRADLVQALVEAARNEGYRAGLKSLADTIESAKVRLTLGRDWITADQQELTAQAYRHIARAALAAFDNTKENK